MPLTRGDKAPTFSLTADDGRIVTSASLLGQRTILYFYPKDDTPGCTKEACGFRDIFPQFQKLSVPVLGISRDDPARHQKFKLKYELPFTLLSDEDGAVCQAYGVWDKKSLYGRFFF